MTTDNEIRTQIAASLDGPVSAELLDEMTYAYIDMHGCYRGVTEDLHQLVAIFTDGKVTADVSKLRVAKVAARPPASLVQLHPAPTQQACHVAEPFPATA